MTQLPKPRLQVVLVSILGFGLGLALMGAMLGQEKGEEKRTQTITKRRAGLADRRNYARRISSPSSLPSNDFEDSKIIARLDSFKAELATFSSEQYLEKAEELHELPWGEYLITSKLLFQSWGAKAPKDALSFLEKLADPELTSLGEDRYFLLRFQGDLFEGWASVDPVGASRSLDSSSWPVPLSGALFMEGLSSCEAAVAGQWSLKDPEAAMAWAEKQKDSTGSIEAIYEKLVAHDLPKAKELMLSSRDPEWFSVLIFDELAEINWETAQKFRYEVEENESLVEAYSSQLAKRDLGAALSYISKQPSDVQPDLTELVLSDLIPENPIAVLNFIESNPEALGANLVDYGDLIESLTYRDPAAAARIALKALVEERKASPDEIDSSDQLASPVEIDPYELVRSWTRSDPDAAKQWVENLPEGEFYQSAVLAFATSSAVPIAERIEFISRYEDPESLAKTIESIKFNDAIGMDQ